MKLKGILKATFNALLGGADPELGIAATGELFVINGTLDANGDPVATPEIDVISLVTTTNGITDAASTVVVASALTKTLEFFNQDTANSVFIAFEGVTATTAFWEILPQAYYTPPLITQGAVSAICAATLTATLLINRGT